jgi:hypothetical protein
VGIESIETALFPLGRFILSLDGLFVKVMSYQNEKEWF